jgi:hypothetical protein
MNSFLHKTIFTTEDTDNTENTENTEEKQERKNRCDMKNLSGDAIHTGAKF